eukprot:403361060
MNSKLTILPHITTLIYLRLFDNLNLRLLNHSENKFIIDKYQYFKQKKEILKLSINSQIKSISNINKLQIANHLDQVTVILFDNEVGFKGNENFIYVLKVMKILLDSHNQNNIYGLMNYTNNPCQGQNVKEEMKTDLQSAFNNEHTNQNQKVIKIQLKFPIIKPANQERKTMQEIEQLVQQNESTEQSICIQKSQLLEP